MRRAPFLYPEAAQSPPLLVLLQYDNVAEPCDPTLDVLLDLDGQVLVVDPEGGHWVRFVVTRVPVSPEKPHGLDYSLTLHGPRRAVGRVRQCPSGRAAEARHAAGSSPPAADDQGLRVPRRGNITRRLLGGGGHGVARERSDPVTTLKVGIASCGEMKARTMAVARVAWRPTSPRSGSLRPSPPAVWADYSG
jgi:hypothetical protein